MYTQLTANINTNYIQNIYCKNLEFADAKKKSFFKGINMFIHMQILYQIGFNLKICICQFKLQLIYMSSESLISYIYILVKFVMIGHSVQLSNILFVFIKSGPIYCLSKKP